MACCPKIKTERSERGSKISTCDANSFFEKKKKVALCETGCRVNFLTKENLSLKKAKS